MRILQWLIRTAPFLGTVLFHGAVALALVRTPDKDLSARAPVEFEVVEKVRPRPAPPKPPPPPPKPARIPQVVKVAPPVERPPPPPPDAAPPPPNQPPPREPPKAPVRILAGISLSSTTAAGGFALPVGNTLYGQMPEVAPNPEEVKPYAAARYVPPVEATELPELVGPPSVDRVKDYPLRARQEGVEAICDVLLRVGPDGKVEKTLRAQCTEQGYEFEVKARLIAMRARFKPGKRGGEAISTDINYKFRFELE